MIDARAVHDYEKDGAVCLRGLLAPAAIELLRAGIEANLAAPSPRAIVASAADDPGRFVEDFCNWRHNPCYRRFIFESPLAAVAGRLMQSTSARLYHDHMLTKEPGTRQPTPWHQDQPYYNVVGRQNVSFWIPVDPVSKESTLEFVAGSHRGPWLMPRTFMDAQAKWFPEGSLEELPDPVFMPPPTVCGSLPRAGKLPGSAAQRSARARFRRRTWNTSTRTGCSSRH